MKAITGCVQPKKVLALKRFLKSTDEDGFNGVRQRDDGNSVPDQFGVTAINRPNELQCQ